MLQVKNLTKNFSGLVAVNDLNFELQEGNIMGLVGPNGAGKTTVFNLITGIYKPTKGKILFNGHDITGKNPSEIAALGLVRTFQSNLLFNEQTCFDNVLIAHHLQRRTIFSSIFFSTRTSQNEDQTIREHTEELLECTGLMHVKNQLAKSLPQGSKRALGIAIALATRPRLLLMDEPITGMTHSELGSMMQLIRQLNSQGLTVLLVEHNMRVVMDICHSVVVLNFGQKLAEGTCDEIKNNNDVIQAYLGG